jgi:hypothetical protein
MLPSAWNCVEIAGNTPAQFTLNGLRWVGEVVVLVVVGIDPSSVIEIALTFELDFRILYTILSIKQNILWEEEGQNNRCNSSV